MLSQIVSISLTYRTAPIALREQLAIDLTAVAPWRAAPGNGLLFQPGTPFASLRELVILSTCNRVELFAVTNGQPGAGVAALRQLLSRLCGVAEDRFAAALEERTGVAVADHLCRVAAGLDSLVLGEPQILGQVTDAYMTAVAAHTVGDLLTTLFHTAIHAGKRARSETQISANPASISSVAVAKAGQALGRRRRRRYLIVGLGEMGLLALKALRARNLAPIALINRTPGRAAQIRRDDEIAYAWEDLAPALAAADVVITATSAPAPLLTRALLEEAAGRRRSRPLVLIDIAVPRNVDPAVRDLPGVILYDADELRGDLDEARALRESEIPQIETIIAAELAVFRQQVRELTVKPVIAGLRRKAEAIRQQELARTLRHLDDLDPQTLAHIQHLSRSLVNKLLHEPTLTLKAQAGADDPQATAYALALRDLFGLPVKGSS